MSRLKGRVEEPCSPSFARSFRYPFQSPDGQSRYWIGAGLIFLGFIIPIVPLLFVGGYFMRVLRSRIHGAGAGIARLG